MTEEQSWLMQSTQPAYEFLTDMFTAKAPREVNHPQKTRDVFKESVKPKLMQLDALVHSQKAAEIEGEEFLDYLQPGTDPPEELKTDVQKELGNLLQSKTVKSNDLPRIMAKVLSGALQHPLKLADVLSAHANPSQRPPAQSQDYTSPVSTSEKLHPLGTVRSSETMKSAIRPTFQSERSWKPCRNACVSLDGLSASDPGVTPSSTNTVPGQLMSSSHTDSRVDLENLDEFFGLAETRNVQSEKNLQQLQDKSLKSNGPCGSFHTARGQQEDKIILPKTTTDLSEEPGDFSNAASGTAINLCASKTAQTVQIENPFNQQLPVMEDLTETRRAMSCYSKVPPHQSLECPQATKATENYQDCTADPTRNLAAESAESFNAEQASTCNSEEIYLSCGSHWSSRVTANKVAVEGDLMASIIEVKRKRAHYYFVI